MPCHLVIHTVFVHLPLATSCHSLPQPRSTALHLTAPQFTSSLSCSIFRRSHFHFRPSRVNMASFYLFRIRCRDQHNRHGTLHQSCRFRNGNGMDTAICTVLCVADREWMSVETIFYASECVSGHEWEQHTNQSQSRNETERKWKKK